jgi:hypothetical protein
MEQRQGLFIIVHSLIESEVGMDMMVYIILSVKYIVTLKN